MTVPVAATAATESRSRLSVIIVFGAVVFCYAALEAMRGPALPVIQQGVGASAASVAWVFTGMELTAAVSLPLVSRLADLRGRKRLFLIVLTIVIAGTAVSATATSIVVLALGQVLQGVGSGFVPLALGMFTDTNPAAEAKSGTGLVIGMTALGAIAGLILAGPLLAVLSYHWLFWLPLCGLVLVWVLAVFLLPSGGSRGAGRVDWWGAVLLGTALAAVLLGMTMAPEWGWTSPGFLVLVALGVLLLAGFVARELRVEAPLVDLRLGGRAMLATCVVAFAVGWATITTYLTIPVIVTAPPEAGYGLGAATTVVGLLVLPIGVVAAVTAPFTGRLERALGAKRLMVLSCVPIAMSSAIMLIGRHDAVLLALAAGVMGLGLGVGLTQATNVVVSAAPRDRVASASGFLMIVRAVGNTLGAQITGSLLAGATVVGTRSPTWSMLTTVLLVATALGLVATVAAVALPRRVTAV